jgi:hypothetical protein
MGHQGLSQNVQQQRSSMVEKQRNNMVLVEKQFNPIVRTGNRG